MKSTYLHIYCLWFTENFYHKEISQIFPHSHVTTFLIPRNGSNTSSGLNQTMGLAKICINRQVVCYFNRFHCHVKKQKTNANLTCTVTIASSLDNQNKSNSTFTFVFRKISVYLYNSG